MIHRFSNQANGEGNYVDYYSDLVSVHSEFQNENGSTYYYDPRTGAKQTGWANINSNNYYFDPSTGAMFTGTHTVDGKSYDFGSNGVAVENDKWVGHSLVLVKDASLVLNYWGKRWWPIPYEWIP